MIATLMFHLGYLLAVESKKNRVLDDVIVFFYSIWVGMSSKAGRAIHVEYTVHI